jgi:hypothetical protein
MKKLIEVFADLDDFMKIWIIGAFFGSIALLGGTLIEGCIKKDKLDHEYRMERLKRDIEAARILERHVNTPKE